MRPDHIDSPVKLIIAHLLVWVQLSSSGFGFFNYKRTVIILAQYLGSFTLNVSSAVLFVFTAVPGWVRETDLTLFLLLFNLLTFSNSNFQVLTKFTYPNFRYLFSDKTVWKCCALKFKLVAV